MLAFRGFRTRGLNVNLRFLRIAKEITPFIFSAGMRRMVNSPGLAAADAAVVGGTIALL